MQPGFGEEGRAARNPRGVFCAVRTIAEGFTLIIGRIAIIEECDPSIGSSDCLPGLDIVLRYRAAVDRVA